MLFWFLDDKFIGDFRTSGLKVETPPTHPCWESLIYIKGIIKFFKWSRTQMTWNKPKCTQTTFKYPKWAKTSLRVEMMQYESK